MGVWSNERDTDSQVKRGAMKVLIVEDERKLGQVLAQGLREHGFTVDWAEEGNHGLQMASQSHYDVLILDVMLPGKDGFQILEHLRSAKSAVPILMLTARSGVDDRVRGLDLGADDYLSKPFDFKELLARVRALSRRPATEPRTILQVADLELDLQAREVRRSGRSIELTAKEFALLECLMRHPGLVLTRTMIMDRVWSSEVQYDGDSNLVEVYINFLRKKVDQGFSAKLIHTVRGAGYVLREPT